MFCSVWDRNSSHVLGPGPCTGCGSCLGPGPGACPGPVTGLGSCLGPFKVLLRSFSFLLRSFKVL